MPFCRPYPQQDLCVANLNASISVNGFPCKPVPEVKLDDFFFDGLSKEDNTTKVFGSNVTAGNVLVFPGLNTLGISMNRVDFTPGGVNLPNIHPRAIETGVVMKGKLISWVRDHEQCFALQGLEGRRYVCDPHRTHSLPTQCQKREGPCNSGFQ
ncbi:hypothetical protein HHK36_007137 [Tetracentron sinense]|uniref:Cupin type-1 domain-containing protein n=1 Tax=Tetracentron sinense TaxID=13715 RepID=A0A834ZKD5_TETSI|nr:hypothetical protein HHK36_007137 [Tetracentron sinense]